MARPRSPILHRRMDFRRGDEHGVVEVLCKLKETGRPRFVARAAEQFHHRDTRHG
jgi:hypothetical protein